MRLFAACRRFRVSGSHSMSYEFLVGLRYTRSKRRAQGRNRFISFISLVSMLGIALGVALYRRGRVLTERGTFAVDFQLSRSLAAQVASGPYSFLGGGLNNSATGESSGVVAGGGNSATAYGAVVAGGSENDANGANSFIGGGAGATTRGIFAAHAHAGGGVWGPGTSQTCVYVVSTNTGGATEGTLSI